MLHLRISTRSSRLSLGNGRSPGLTVPWASLGAARPRGAAGLGHQGAVGALLRFSHHSCPEARGLEAQCTGQRSGSRPPRGHPAHAGKPTELGRGCFPFGDGLLRVPAAASCFFSGFSAENCVSPAAGQAWAQQVRGQRWGKGEAGDPEHSARRAAVQKHSYLLRLPTPRGSWKYFQNPTDKHPCIS